jgi:hypothetical protein
MWHDGTTVYYGEMNFALLVALQEGACRARCKA